MHKGKVFISTSSFATSDPLPLKMLKGFGLECQINPYGRKLAEEECLTFYKDIDGLIAGTELLSEVILRSAKNLKVISRCGIGLDNVDIATAKELGIKIFSVSEGPKEAVAELTVGLILSLLRRITMEDRLIRTGVWKKQIGNLLMGKTLGVLGLGGIGKMVVRLTVPFNLKYIAWDVSPDLEFQDKYHVKYTDLKGVLKEADILTIHLSFSSELKNIIGKDEIALMKKEVLLVNTARGELIDEIALYKALKEKRIAGAALDVFKEEPYNGVLKELDNVILTPHIGSYAKETRVKMEIQAVENLIKGLNV